MGFMMAFSCTFIVNPFTSYLLTISLAPCAVPHSYFIDHPFFHATCVLLASFSSLISLPNLHWRTRFSILMFSFYFHRLCHTHIYKHENLNLGVLSRENTQYLIFWVQENELKIIISSISIFFKHHDVIFCYCWVQLYYVYIPHFYHLFFCG